MVGLFYIIFFTYDVNLEKKDTKNV